MRVKLPRLLDAQMKEKKRLHPSDISLTFNLHTPHQARASIPITDPDVSLHDWVRLYTIKGDAGIFRVTSRDNSVGQEIRIGLRHSLCILASDKVNLTDEYIEGTLKELLQRFWASDGVTVTPQYWQLGSIPDTAVIRYRPQNHNLQQAVQTVLKSAKNYALGFDQSVFPWLLNVVELSAEESCEGRFSRNLTGVDISEDDYDLVTRVYVEGRYGYTDADTIETWGVVSETLTIADDATDESVALYVADYLEAHKNPRVTIELSGVELSNITKEPIDSFDLGVICRACLPKYATTLRERIVAIEYPDVYAEPSSIRVSMTNTVETTPDLLVYNVRELDALSASTGRRFGGVSAAIQQNAFEIYRVDTETAGQFNQVYFRMDAQDTRIDLMATREELTEIDYTLSQVSVALDAAEAELALKASQETTDKLSDQIAGAEAELLVQAGAIALKASQYDVDALGNRLETAESELIVQTGLISSKVSEDGVISAINQTAESILIQASRINLSGFVTASTFNAEMAQIDNIFAGYSEISALGISGNLYAANARFTDNVSLLERVCNWQGVTMGDVASSTLLGAGTGGALDLQHSHKLEYDEVSGTFTLAGVSSSGDSFRVADTKAYKDAVASAQSAVTLSTAGWINGVNEVKASNGKSLTVELPDFNTSGGTSWINNKTTVYFSTPSVNLPLAIMEVDASSVYNSVTLSAAGWSGNTNIVSTSNGKRVTVGLPTLTMKSGDWYDDHTMYVHLWMTDGRGNEVSLNSIKIDANDIYNAGWEAAKAATTVLGSIEEIRNTAANTFFARGYARALVGGVQVTSTTFSGTQTINVGQ